MKQKEVQIPLWLVSNESSCEQVSETLNHVIPSIDEKAGCNIFVEERESEETVHIWLIFEAPVEPGIWKIAIEMVENSLIRLLGKEEAHRRLLYDMALSYSRIVRPDGPVLQRNPLDLNERVWMYIVELPADVWEGGLQYFAPLFLDYRTQDSIHQADCTVELCRDSFSVTLERCQHYALVFGKTARTVSDAIIMTKNALKLFK